MKNWINEHPWLVAVGLLVVGLFLGYLLGGMGNGSESSGQERTHAHEGTSENTTWTCSMHPQIKSSEPGDCPICGMDLVPMEEAGGEESEFQIKMTETAVRIAHIQTSKVEKVTPTKTIHMNGKIEADETSKAYQAAHYSGRLEKMAINFEGETVRKGQVIGEVYSPELVSAQEEFLQAQRMTEQQPALLKAARSKLKSWKLTDKQLDELASSGEVKEYSPLISNVSGTVTELNVSEGDYVKAGQTLFSVSNFGRLWVMLEAYESDLNWMNVGDAVSVAIPAYPDLELKARIRFIDPVIDPKRRVAKVRVEVPNAGGKLKPEMFVRATLEAVTGAGKPALAVPRSAVMWTGPRSVAYVQLKQQTPVFETREVELGPSLGDKYVVLSGLYEGEDVVSQGAFTVDAAAQLNNKASMMNRLEALGEASQPPPETLNLEAPDLSESPSVKSALQEILDTYLELKNALVETDSTLAAEKAAALHRAIAQSSAKPDGGKALDFWEEELGIVEKRALSISEAKSPSVQRDHFLYLSAAAIRLAKAFAVEEGFYLQYCPMADSDQGGFWISREDEILNPYFGDRMLHCGEVREWE